MKYLSIILLVTLILSGCNEQENIDSQPPSVSNQSDLSTDENAINSVIAESHRINQWFDEKFAEEKDFSPQFKTRLGDKSDYDKLDDYSIAAMDEELQWRRNSVVEMKSEFDYEQLTDEAKLSYDMWLYSLEQSERDVQFRQHGYIFGRGGPHASMPNFLINYHQVDNEADLQAYIARLKELDRVFEQLLVRAREASEAGIRQPQFAYEFAIEEIGRITEGAPFNNSDSRPNSPLWSDLQTKIETLVEGELITSQRAQELRDEAAEVLSGEVLSAYDALLTWLEQDKTLAADIAQGVWALPAGEDYYNYRLARMTTLDLSADEIHEIGLSEVARLRTEMEAILEKVNFAGSLQEFFVYMREGEQFYFPNTDAGRQEYLDLNNAYLSAITAKLPEYFGRLPKAQLEVRRVESFREQAGAAQHYAAGAPDGSRPGVFYSHMLDMGSLPIYQIEDVAYHEGNPGHHMQISIQQELTEVPEFRTQYRSTAYTEGWGLYAERLAKDMGFYEDPYSDFGRLTGEIWRAIRLVVDTGIHSRQWTEQQAVDYFMENSPQPESAVKSEIQRYITGPGQATAYKIGMMKFQQLQEQARSELDAAFDIREFHDVVLGAGALPMPLLEARVAAWVDLKQAGSTAQQ